MSAENTLYSTLSGASGVTAIVGTAIYPDILPQDAEVPAVAFARTGTEFVSTIHAAAPLGASVTLEISCIARTREDADALADAVETAASAGGFVIADRQAQLDLETDLWATMLSAIYNE